MNRIISVDTINRTITVEAGARIGDISLALAAHGLALPSLPFPEYMTIGGVISTGTHGTSLKWGTVADSVLSMTLVTGSGELKTLTSSQNNDDLSAARVAVGMLGVIVQVTLQVIAMPWVRLSRTSFALKDLNQSLKALLSTFDHVWLHWTLGTDRVAAQCLETSIVEDGHFHPYVRSGRPLWRDASQRSPFVEQGIARLYKIRRLMKAVAAPIIEGLPKYPAAFLHMSMQYGTRFDQLDFMVDEIRNSHFAREHPGKIVELKFMKRSDLSFLGSNAGQDAVLFNLWWLTGRAEARKVFQPFESLMQRFHARPHWGKLHSVPDDTYMESAFPNWSRFKEVRDRYDPEQVFGAIPS